MLRREDEKMESVEAREPTCNRCDEAPRFIPKGSVKFPVVGGVKHCPGCHQDKPVQGFPSSKTRPNGLRTYCKVCTNAKNNPRVIAWLRRQSGPKEAERVAELLAILHGDESG